MKTFPKLQTPPSRRTAKTIHAQAGVGSTACGRAWIDSSWNRILTVSPSIVGVNCKPCLRAVRASIHRH